MLHSAQFKTGEKKLWAHPLNENRITLNIIESFICDQMKKNYTCESITTFDFIIQQIGDEIRKE